MFFWSENIKTKKTKQNKKQKQNKQKTKTKKTKTTTPPQQLARQNYANIIWAIRQTENILHEEPKLVLAMN